MSDSVVLKASIDKHFIVEPEGITAVEFVVKWGGHEVSVFDTYCDAERYIDTELYEWYIAFKGEKA